jgi:hypothetical protein
MGLNGFRFQSQVILAWFVSLIVSAVADGRLLDAAFCLDSRRPYSPQNIQHLLHKSKEMARHLQRPSKTQVESAAEPVLRTPRSTTRI